MIESFYSLGTINSTAAFFVALLIGVAFGVCLEQAGFGSSRKLAAIFYFRDMTVLKVMFTAVITALLGLSYCTAFGIVRLDNVFLMPTFYTAQVVGGVLLGFGFVIGSWCPGTAAVGLASGKLDALVFLFGAVGGSILFNESFTTEFVQKLYTQGDSGVRFVYEHLGVSRTTFTLLFTLVAIGCFWGAEYIEKRRGQGTFRCYWDSRFLRFFSMALLLLAIGLFVWDMPLAQQKAPTAATEQQLLNAVAAGEDHIEPEQVADRLLQGDSTLLVVDVRPAGEFARFHLRGAVNIEVGQLAQGLIQYKEKRTIVLYSNGMTHPAQARDALVRLGYGNLFIMTDGLRGFIERCLKPASLRESPVPAEQAARIKAWREYFYAAPTTPPVSQDQLAPKEARAVTPLSPDRLVETAWLADNLNREDVKILDCREQQFYNGGHIPGAIFVSVESFRGVVDSVPSMLLPADMLVAQLSLLGIRADDMVVLVADDKIHNATLASMVFARIGHVRYGILHGGMGKWMAEKRPLSTTLPAVRKSSYPVTRAADDFTVDRHAVLAAMQRKEKIIDVRPEEFFSGKKVEEARGGHIPGAVNRPFSNDVKKQDGYLLLRGVDELAKAYAEIIPDKETRVIVHCRTGHQASQTFFVLNSLLGYRNVYWYDAGWTEWASRPELPVSVGEE